MVSWAVARKWNIGCRWSLWLILHLRDKPTVVMMMMIAIVASKVLKKCVGDPGIIFIGAIHTF